MLRFLVTATRFRPSPLLARPLTVRAAVPRLQIVGRRFESNKARDPSLQADWSAPLVSYQEVKLRSETPSEDNYLIDVREPDEVIQGSIPSAVSLPLSGIGKSLSLTPPEFKQLHGFNKPMENQEIIFYCRSGKRSASACDVARRNGYKNIKNYEGSWLDWVERQGKQ